MGIGRPAPLDHKLLSIRIVISVALGLDVFPSTDQTLIYDFLNKGPHITSFKPIKLYPINKNFQRYQTLRWSLGHYPYNINPT